MDWNPSILKLTEAKYSTYDEWVDNFGFQDSNAETFVYTSKVLNNATQDLLFRSNIRSTQEPKASNIRLRYICGELYPLI